LSTNRRAAFFAAFLLLLPCSTTMAQPATITVFAASSMTDSMKEVADAYKAKSGISVILSFGASSTLARQIDQGAPADLFISADIDWMDFLQKNGRIAEDTRKDLLGNQLVLVAAKDAKSVLKIGPKFDLLGALNGGKLAMADPNSVPAGKYGKAALVALGVWDSVAPSVVQAENVRVALEYVAREEAPFGIVYATDAKVVPVKVVGIFPPDSHPPITYPVALTKSANPAAKDFLAFLSGAQAQAIFEKAGFTVR
jgi:molybdate transport system substrate-binding protein